MRRKLITLASLACAGVLALSWKDLHAQPVPAAPAAPAAPANPTDPVPATPATPTIPGQPPAPLARPRGQRPFIYQRTLMALQQTKFELQHATNDFAGHRDTAIDACEKTIAELQAVMKAAGIQPMMPRPRALPPAPAQTPSPSPAPAPVQPPPQ